MGSASTSWARTAVVVGLLALPSGCRDGDREQAKATSEAGARAKVSGEPPTRDEPVPGVLEEAAVLMRVDAITLARLARSLPRPSPAPSPLVTTFGEIVGAFVGESSLGSGSDRSGALSFGSVEGARARLALLGLAPGEPVILSMRALDGRAAAVRKLLGELEPTPEAGDERVEDLASQARTLGAHMRASLPVASRDRLVGVLRTVAMLEGSGAAVETACESLEGVVACGGRERLIVWAREQGRDRLRVDAVYLFHGGAEPRDLARALARADQRSDVQAPRKLHEPGALELAIQAAPSETLLQAEALADAVEQFVAGEVDYHGYLDREQALRDLVPHDRIFNGLELGLSLHGDRDLQLALRWLPGPGPEVAATLARLFAPPDDQRPLPALDASCRGAVACLRVAGLSVIPRFADQARGPFATTTGAARVLRQAGDRGMILLGLATWPKLIGTAAALVDASPGITGRAQARLIGDAVGFGAIMLSLGEAPGGEEWVAYLRLSREALEAIHPAATILGLGLHPIELHGIQAELELGALSWEGETVQILLAKNQTGGWLIFGDDEARLRWLLEHPLDEATGRVEPLWFVHVDELGAAASRDELPYTEDPPVRSWLDGRRVELRGSFTSGGPLVEIEVRAKD